MEEAQFACRPAGRKGKKKALFRGFAVAHPRLPTYVGTGPPGLGAHARKPFAPGRSLRQGVLCAREEGVPLIAITAQRRSEVIYPAKSGVFQGLGLG